MHSSTVMLLACIGLAACAGAPGHGPTAAGLTMSDNRPSLLPDPPRPAIAPTDLDVADYMYGPAPHNRVDPRMRCRFNCPTYPADLPPPVR